MRESDLERFAEILNGLAAVKPGKDLTKEAVKLWWNSMQDWSIDEFAAAAEHLNRTVEFMPSAYHFEQLRKAGKHTADEAWQVALERCKQWRTPREALDAIDRTAAAIGGYRAIALADMEFALPHVQRRFLEAYDKIDKASEVREALPAIASSPELPAPRANCRDGRFAAIAAPAPAPRITRDQPAQLASQSREQVTAWLKKAGQ